MADDLRWHVSWFRVLLMVPLLPFYILFAKRRAGRVSTLQELREFHLTISVSLFVLAAALAEVVHGQPHRSSPRWPIVVLAVVCLYGILAGAWFGRRPWPVDAPAEKLAAYYRASYYLQVAFATSVALYGFVAVFLTTRLWLYLASMSVALVWLWAVGPTTANIARRDRQLRAMGAQASLADALTVPPA